MLHHFSKMGREHGQDKFRRQKFFKGVLNLSYLSKLRLFKWNIWSTKRGIAISQLHMHEVPPEQLFPTSFHLPSALPDSSARPAEQEDRKVTMSMPDQSRQYGMTSSRLYRFMTHNWCWGQVWQHLCMNMHVNNTGNISMHEHACQQYWQHLCMNMHVNNTASKQTL